MAPTKLLNAIRVRLSDGTAHQVRHPTVPVGVRTTLLGIPDPENPEPVGFTVRLGNARITELEPLAAVR